MKNFKKKALLPALIMVMVSVIALSSATYAWFTLGQDATINDLEVNVVAASGIQFSLDAATWKSVLTADEIKAAGIFPTGDLSPVSTNAKTNGNGRLDFYSAVVNESDGKLTTSAVSAPAEMGGKLSAGDGQYITFDLYVKVTSKANLYLNSLSKVTSANGFANLASRVAFIDQGSVGLDKDAADAIKLKATNGNTAVVWEPNASEHVVEAKQNGRVNEGGAANNPYKGVAGIASDIPNMPDAQHAALEAVVTTDDHGEGKAGGLIATLEAGINKITVTIWLEGQDGDCVNSASGGTLNTFLKFTKEDIA